MENKECDKSEEATCTKMITIQFSEGDDAQIIKYVLFHTVKEQRFYKKKHQHFQIEGCRTINTLNHCRKIFFCELIQIFFWNETKYIPKYSVYLCHLISD